MILRDHILRMPMGTGDGGGSQVGGGFDPAQAAQAQLEGLEIQEKRSKIEKEIAEALGNNLEAAKQQIEIDRIRVSSGIQILESYKNQQHFAAELAKSGKTTKEFLEEQLKLSQLNTDEVSKMLKARQGEELSLERVIENLEEYRARQEQSKDFARDIASSTSKLARSMGIAADFSKTTAGSFVEMGQKFLSSDKAASGQAILGAINGLINPMNMLASLFDIAVKKMIALDKAAVGLRVATGFARDFQGEMTAVAASAAQVGVALDKSNEAFGAVVKTIKGINDQSPQFVANLAESAAKMTKLGVSANTSAKNFNLLIKSFKMTDVESTAMMESMAAKASDLGLTAEEMGTEFNSAMGYLSSFGKEGIKAFEDLAAQAGVTGLAISKMLDMTKAFDKFSEGAKKAATLNSVLGTSLSSMALMTMNPAERMKELRNQINSATGGVKNMTQAQKLFTAEAMGYSSVAEMMADLQASPSELAERAELAKRQAQIQERLANAMTELLPLTERISMAFEKLATNESLMRGLGVAIEFVVDAVAFVAGNFKVLAFITTGLSAAFTIFKLKALATAAGITTINTASTTFAIRAYASAVAQGVNTTAMSAAELAMYNYGRAQIFAMGKMLLFVSAVGLLIYYLTKPNSPPFYLIFGVIAIAVFFFGRALDSMGPKAIIAALALALLAGAISLIFYGMAALVESITGLFTTMSQSVDTMPAVIIGIFALGAAFLFLGYAASFSSMGIFMGLAALTAMFLLFKLTGTSMADMFGAGDEILKIGTGIEKFGQGLNNIKSAVGEIKGALGDKGLFAGSVSGDSSSLVMGDGVAVAKLFKNSKIEVDVKMPEIAMPKVDVKVFIGNEELKDIIRKEVLRGQK